MKLLSLIISVLINAYKPSADPNLFGSKNRWRSKNKLAGEFKDLAGETQSRIDELQSLNPFESASAKAAMAKASRNAKLMQTRSLNTLGANASPETLVAMQGATNEALGSAAGQIAAVSEADKNNQVANLERLKTSQMGMYGQMGANAADEYGSGWGTLFQGIDSLGKLASGGGQAAQALGLGASGGGGAAAAALGSDINIKENIRFIGTLQGQRIYKYNYKNSPEVHIGVIAQEVETQNPEFVVNDGGVKKVFYDKVFSGIKE